VWLTVAGVKLEGGSVDLRWRLGDTAGFVAGAADCCWAVWERTFEERKYPGIITI